MNNKKQISASIMCADLLNLSAEIKELEEAQIDYLHLDIMDGSFVPNITLGIDVCNYIGEYSTVLRDIHLLVENPIMYIGRLNLKKDELITVHYEANANIKILSKMVRKKGAKFGIALNPETSILVLDGILNDIDFVVLMMIKPGFAGLKMEAGMIEKIGELRRFLLDKNRDDILIEVDGNVSFKNAELMSHASANIFVAGSSSVFSKKDSIFNCTLQMREKIIINNDKTTY